MLASDQLAAAATLPQPHDLLLAPWTDTAVFPQSSDEADRDSRVHIGLAQFSRVIAELHALDEDGQTTAYNRLRNLAKVGFPRAFAKRGEESTGYDAEQSLKIILAHELLRLGATQNFAIATLSANWPCIADALARTWQQMSDGDHATAFTHDVLLLGGDAIGRRTDRPEDTMTASAIPSRGSSLAQMLKSIGGAGLVIDLQDVLERFSTALTDTLTATPKSIGAALRQFAADRAASPGGVRQTERAA